MRGVAGGPRGERCLPSVQVADEAQRPVDLTEHTRRVLPRRRLIVQQGDPPADGPQRLPGDRERQCRALHHRQRLIQAALVGVDQPPEVPQPLVCGGRIGTGEVVERQREIVDAGALAHEVEVGDEHYTALAEADVVMPVVAVHHLPWQQRGEFAFGGGDGVGQFL